MPFIVQDNFQVNIDRPIDTRMVATNSTARNEINPLVRYDGMKVFQLDNRQTYIWNGTVSGTWSLESSGSVTGTGSSGFLTQWNASSVVGSSIVYNLVNGTLSGLPVGFLGINTPSTGNLQPREALQVNSPQNSSPPFVVHKGGTTILGENWYFTSTEQNFQVDRGSSLIQFDNGSMNFRVRAANQPQSTSVAVQIANNGSVGIGGAPSERLTVASGANDRIGLNISGTTTQLILGSSLVTEGMAVFQYDRSTGTYQFSAGTNGDTSNPDISVLANGNVGIGLITSSSSDKLRINGNLMIEGGLINLGPSSTPTFNRTAYITSDATNLQINRQTTHPINFATSNVNRVRIEATGELSPLFGIKFPASQVASSDVNTLDDYEEGVISIGQFVNLYRQIASPANLSFSSAGGSFTGNIKYVKVGKAVTISGWMTLNWTAINGTTHGARTVEFVLPFAPSSSSEGGIGVHLVCPQWTVSPGSPYGGTICIQSVSGNPVVLVYHKFGSSTGNPTVTHFKSLNSGVCDIFLTFTYIANS